MYAIAADKPFYDALPDRLQKRLGQPFYFLKRKEELTLPNLQKREIKRVFVVHWSHIIPQEVFENIECVIFHMTDLPYGRGGSPLQNLIVRGIKETKISALLCSAELDTGPIYLKAPLSLEGTAEEIFRRASNIIEDMIGKLVKEEIKPVAQSGPVVRFNRRKPEDGNLEPLSTFQQIYDYIRMLDAEGYPHAFIDAGKFHLEFSGASLNADHVSANVKIMRKADEGKK